MNRTIALIAAFAVAASVAAQTKPAAKKSEPAPAPAATAPPASQGVTMPVIVEDSAPTAADSPLVAAAKRARRSRTAISITNENLQKATEGSFTTTSNQRPLPLPILPAPPAGVDNSKNIPRVGIADRPPAKAADPEQQKKKLEQAITTYEAEGLYLDTDPATAEKALEEMSRQQQAKPGQPQAQPSKPPNP